MDNDGKIRAWDVLGRETELDPEDIRKTEAGIFGIRNHGIRLFTRRVLTRNGQTYFLKGRSMDGWRREMESPG